MSPGDKMIKINKASSLTDPDSERFSADISFRGKSYDNVRNMLTETCMIIILIEEVSAL
jgi:hypothetical protein